jgi:hypothetical protein
MYHPYVVKLLKYFHKYTTLVRTSTIQIFGLPHKKSGISRALVVLR